MTRPLSLVPLAALLLAPAYGDQHDPPGPPAAELLGAGLDRARDQGKRVFLLFGSPG